MDMKKDNNAHVPKAVKPLETCLNISLRMRAAGAVPQAGEESCQRPVHMRGTSTRVSAMGRGKVSISAGSGEGVGRGTMTCRWCGVLLDAGYWGTG